MKSKSNQLVRLEFYFSHNKHSIFIRKMEVQVVGMSSNLLVPKNLPRIPTECDVL